MPENPDAEKAALAEALARAWQRDHLLVCRCRRRDFKVCPDKHCQQRTQFLANLSPAAKEILEKAQAHDAMKAENERLRAALHRPQCPSTKAIEIVDGASQTYPSRRGRCSVCGHEGPVNNSGNLWRHSSQAALKESE